MQLSEFKAWFEGFTESMSGAPTKKQFDRIKERVAEIDGKPIVQTVWLNDYHRYYWPHNYPYNYPQGIFGGMGQATSAASLGALTIQSAYASNSTLTDKGQVVTEAFDPHAAMFAIGKAEAMN
jgi:hypothetical protein